MKETKDKREKVCGALWRRSVVYYLHVRRQPCGNKDFYEVQHIF